MSDSIKIFIPESMRISVEILGEFTVIRYRGNLDDVRVFTDTGLIKLMKSKDGDK